jgi:hypothetical protein
MMAETEDPSPRTLDDQELAANRREAFIEFDEDPDPSAELTRRYAELNNEFIRRHLWTRGCNAQR